METKLFVTTPCYGGQVFVPYMLSLMSLWSEAAARQLPMMYYPLSGHSCISQARSACVARFMNRTDATHLLFIDADLQFEASHVMRLLGHGKDLVAGVYPCKALRFARMQEVLARGATWVEAYTSLYDFPLETIDGSPRIQAGPDGLFEAARVGCGMMLMTREGVSRACEANPALKYSVRGERLRRDIGDVAWDLFQPMVQDGRSLGEDYSFCDRWRAAGGGIWADAEVVLNHVGTFVFGSDSGE